MAILCLYEDLTDLKNSLGAHPGRIRPLRRSGNGTKPQATGASGELQDAVLPESLQSAEGVPTFVHGGPFGNIAHGCNSVIATKTAATHADFAVTEAGLASISVEKFFDLKCRSSGLWPSVVVLVVTVRALGSTEVVNRLAVTPSKKSKMALNTSRTTSIAYALSVSSRLSL